MVKIINSLSEASKRKKKFILMIKLCPVDLAHYNKTVFSSGRVVVTANMTTWSPDPPLSLELKSDRFLPRKMIEVLYEDED